jgi:phosphatidylglycerol:prolipoprotein diacylglycerol transferase
MLAYYVHKLSPFIVEFRPGIGLRWYGLAYVLAFLIGYHLYRWLAAHRYTELRPEQVGDFILWAAVFGVMLGGRLGWVLFYLIPHEGLRTVIEHPIELIRVWQGGMASHGGVLGLMLFTLWYSRRHKIPWTSLGDSLCTVAPVGLFLVRIANFINGELYGRPSTVPWAVQFPDDPMQPRHPSQLYEAFLEGIVLFTLLWILRTRVRLPRGMLTGVFFVAYALLRILGEIFREPDPAWAVGRFSAGQFLSLFMILIGAGFIAWAIKNPRYEPAFASDETDRRQMGV